MCSLAPHEVHNTGQDQKCDESKNLAFTAAGDRRTNHDRGDQHGTDHEHHVQQCIG